MRLVDDKVKTIGKNIYETQYWAVGYIICYALFVDYQREESTGVSTARVETTTTTTTIITTTSKARMAKGNIRPLVNT